MSCFLRESKCNPTDPVSMRNTLRNHIESRTVSLGHFVYSKWLLRSQSDMNIVLSIQLLHVIKSMINMIIKWYTKSVRRTVYAECTLETVIFSYTECYWQSMVKSLVVLHYRGLGWLEVRDGHWRENMR